MRKSQALSVAVVALCMILFALTAGAGVTRTDAIGGTPYGVGMIELTLSERDIPREAGIQGVELIERNGRIYYPTTEIREIPGVVKNVFSQAERPIGRIIGAILETQPPSTVIYFLFDGEQPLDVTVMTETPQRVVIRPRRDEAAYARMVDTWWRKYSAPPSALAPKDDYPPIVDNYMLTMLAYRFQLPAPDDAAFGKPLVGKWQNDFSQQLGLAFDAQPYVLAMQRERFNSPGPYLEQANRPLPPPLDLTPPASFAPVATDEPKPPLPEIEPIANYVPQECFYIRFGRFNNFVWLQDALASWGGDVQNLLALRGLDYHMTERIETQLALKQSTLARMFGESVIADVAIIGTDTFMQDGGSFGFLFQAKNNMLLSADFMRQRKERADAVEGSTFDTINIDGHRVSRLETPDGATRSFYAQVGDYHLVSRSKEVVRLFLNVDPDKTSLGSLEAFQQMRVRFPIDREDTIYAYFSRPFLANLTSPAYRIKTRRRMQALADIQLLQLAMLAGKGHGMRRSRITELRDAAFLPSSFGQRPDGAEAVVGKNGVVSDTKWGRPGQFLPLADLAIDAVTPSEAADYARFRRFFHEHWSNIDPVVVAIKREKLADGRDQVTADAWIAPLSIENYDRLQQTMGAPSDQRLAGIPGDIGAFEIRLSDAHWFGGLRDLGARSLPREASGRPVEQVVERAAPNRIFRDLLAGYLGAVDGRLGWMSFLNIGFSRADAQGGYSKTPLGRWRLIYGRYTLFSFQQSVLADVAPHLELRRTSHPSQAWLDIGDVSQAAITPTLNNLLYARTRDTARGNLRLMQSLREQLHVPAADCKKTAQRLLGAELISPLGGTYEYDQRRGRWTCAALESARQGDLWTTTAPPGFVAPPLNWFRGLDAQLRFDRQSLSAHAELIMEPLDE